MAELFKPIYIDGRKLWKKFDEAGLFVDYYDRDIAQGVVEDMMQRDGFEIVKCKDCWKRDKHCFDRILEDDDFCSYGERKE